MSTSENIFNIGKDALFWSSSGNDVQCLLCPHYCIIAEGRTGLCKVRKHVPGKRLLSLSYGLFSSISVDPVEKKPLYHWHPGSKILSLGSVGCNMTCPFCQNWPIATWEQNLNLFSRNIDQIIELATTHGLESVAFTYNEPLVGFEFLMDAAIKIKDANLNVVIVSNGLINKQPLTLLVPYLDAANIDLKAFTGESYKKLNGNLETVKESILLLVEEGIHLEITHLIVPGINDDLKSFQSMVRWIKSISEDLVLHLTRYFPNYLWNEAPTSLNLMKQFEEIARSQLNFVYVGNIPGESVTYCKRCGREIIVRNGYSVSLCRTDSNGKCPYCGTDNYIEI